MTRLNTDTTENVWEHNRIAMELEQLEHQSVLVAWGFVIFWVLWVAGVVFAIMYYI